ncbi:MAG TPA: hypothetical protein PLZ36_08705 [Armatimonadota bacterium]|nr:hypothetical protein [Armatimonadota bacterium]HOS43002.1 hypothetical protein [Armatimonadota bacterium]
MRTLVATLLLAAGLAAFATPSTLVTIPSTDMQAAGTWRLGADTVVPMTASESVPFFDLGLTYGASPRVEVGVDFISPADTPLWLNAKVLVLTPARSPVPVAVGVYNFGTNEAENQRVLYAVGSYVLPVADGLRLTAGAWQANDKAAAIGTEDTGIMLGLDTTIGKWWLGADYVSGDSALGSVNVGVGYALTDSIGVILGYDHYNASGATDAVNFQLDVNF